MKKFNSIIVSLAVFSSALLSACTGTGARLDRTQQKIHAAAEAAAEKLDQKFSHDRPPPTGDVEAASASPFRLAIDTAVFDRASGAEADLALDLDVTLSLPNIERRLKLYATTDELAEPPDVDSADRRRLRVGARFAFLEHVDFDLGVRAEIWPVAFAALQWRRFHAHEHWRFTPFVKTYLESEAGFGVATGLTTDYLVGPWLLRSASYVDWETERDAALWRQTFVIAHVRDTLQDTRPSSPARLRDIGHGTGLRIGLGSEDTATASVDTYSAALFFRRHLHGQWMYWNFGPEVRWERARDWNPDVGIRLGLDILFR
jgi:hypothetical protein